jgi:hypothetical protein
MQTIRSAREAIINAKLLHASENVLFILIYILENVKYTPFTIRTESLTVVYSNSVSIRDLVATQSFLSAKHKVIVCRLLSQF